MGQTVSLFCSSPKKLNLKQVLKYLIRTTGFTADYKNTFAHSVHPSSKVTNALQLGYETSGHATV
jgi:hypothetical protein